MSKARQQANLSSDGNLFADISNDRVGVGSVVPTHKLHVNGTSKFDDDVRLEGTLAARRVIWDKSENAIELGDYTYAKFGLDDDLTVWSNDTASAINNKTGELRILSGTNVRILKRHDAGLGFAGQVANFNIDGACDFYHNGTKRIETLSTGAKVTGNLEVTGVLTYDDVTSIDSVGIVTARAGVHIDDSIVHIGDTDTKIRFPSANTVSIETGGLQNFKVNGTRVALTSPSGTDTTLRLQHQGNSGYGDIILDRSVNAFIISNDPSNASNNQSYFSVKNKGTENLRIHHDGKLSVGTASAGYGQWSFVNEGSSGADATGGETGLTIRSDEGFTNTDVTGSDNWTLKLRNNAYAGGGVSGNQGTVSKILFSAVTSNGHNSFVNIGCDTQGTGGSKGDFFVVPGGGSEALRITSGGKVNIGGNLTQTAAALAVTTSANAFGIRLLSGSNSVCDILNNDSAGNCEIRGYYNNNSGTRGEGFRIESNGESFFSPGGTNVLNIKATGEVLIGRTTKPNDINTLVVTGTSPADNYDSTLYLEGSETSGAINTGGALAFGGHDGSTARNWANIYGVKENGTGGNRASYMSFHTRPGGGAVTERIRIDSHGCLRVGNTHTQTTSGNTKRIALGAKAGIWGWTSGNINGCLTLADNYYWDGSNNRAIEADEAAYLSLRSGSLRFGTTDSTPSAGGVTGLTEKFRIDNDGKVGVGQEPNTKFNVKLSSQQADGTDDASDWGVNGIFQLDAASSGTGNEILLLGAHSGGVGQIASGLGFGRESSSNWGTYLSFKTHSTGTSNIDELNEHLRIASNGILTQKSTSGDNQFVSQRTNAAGSNGNYFFHMKAQDNNGNNVGELGFHQDGQVDAARFVLKTRPNGGSSTERIRVNQSGKIGFGDFSTGTGLLYPLHFKNPMSSSPSWIHMEVTGSNTVGGGGGIAFDTSASNTDSNNGLFLATIAGVRNSDDNGSNDLVFSTSKNAVNGSAPVERLRITSNGNLIQTGSQTITGGTNLAMQNFAVKGIWSGSGSIGKEIELISGYDSAVKMVSIGYNLTDVSTGSTYGGDLVFHTQPLYGNPVTPIPVSMRISSSGYVTKPKTPYFHVQASPSISNSPFDNGIKSFQTVNANNGSHYNNGTGVFTCPVAGFYLFTGAIWSGNSDANNGNNYFLIKRADSNGNNEVQIGGCNHHDDYGQLVISVGYYCAKGDQIFMWYNGSLRGSTPRNYFSGCLIG